MAPPKHYYSIVLLFSVIPRSHLIFGFIELTIPWQVCNVVKTPSPYTTLAFANSPLFSGDDIGNESNDFAGFNPFQPGSKMPSRGGFGILSSDDRKQPPSTPGGRVSPRGMRLKELATNLLACIYDDESVSKLLQSNEELLLEQLNNMDAVLEPDSVFSPSMSRSERFEQYRLVMEDRIRNAKVPAAKKVLMALKDFVASKE